MTEPLAVSIAEARRHLGGVSNSTIYRWHKAGQIEIVHVCGRALIRMSEIRRLLKINQSESHSDPSRGTELHAHAGVIARVAP